MPKPVVGPDVSHDPIHLSDELMQVERKKKKSEQLELVVLEDMVRPARCAPDPQLHAPACCAFCSLPMTEKTRLTATTSWAPSTMATSTCDCCGESLDCVGLLRHPGDLWLWGGL